MRVYTLKALLAAGLHCVMMAALVYKRELASGSMSLTQIVTQKITDNLMGSMNILGHYNEGDGYEVFHLPKSDLVKDHLKEIVLRETREDLSKALILVKDEHSTEVFTEIIHLLEFPKEILSLFIFREKALFERFPGTQADEGSVSAVILVKNDTVALWLQPLLEKCSLTNHSLIVSVHNNSAAVQTIDEYVLKDVLVEVRMEDKVRVILLDDEDKAR